MESSSFYQAIRSGDLARVKSLLDQDPALLTRRDEQGVSPILAAIYNNQHAVLGELIRRISNLDIWEASATGHLLRVKELLDQDPSLLNAFSPDGFTPLGLAAFFGRKAILEELIRRGADVNIPSNNTMKVQALHSAVAQQNQALALQMSEMLLKRGAGVNATQSGGWTPLHEAAFHGEIELVRLLLAWGADETIKSDDGKTPIDLALQQGHADVTEVLQSTRKT
jgi:uncharacterized protein